MLRWQQLWQWQGFIGWREHALQQRRRALAARRWITLSLCTALLRWMGYVEEKKRLMRVHRYIHTHTHTHTYMFPPVVRLGRRVINGWRDGYGGKHWRGDCGECLGWAIGRASPCRCVTNSLYSHELSIQSQLHTCEGRVRRVCGLGHWASKSLQVCNCDCIESS